MQISLDRAGRTTACSHRTWRTVEFPLTLTLAPLPTPTACIEATVRRGSLPSTLQLHTHLPPISKSPHSSPPKSRVPRPPPKTGITTRTHPLTVKSHSRAKNRNRNWNQELELRVCMNCSTWACDSTINVVEPKQATGPSSLGSYLALCDSNQYLTMVGAALRQSLRCVGLWERKERTTFLTTVSIYVSRD
jgi:hypothetical protein